MRFLRKAVIAGPVTDVREAESPPEATASAGSLDDEMAKLIDLRDDGVLSKVEFEARKARLLNTWVDAP